MHRPYIDKVSPSIWKKMVELGGAIKEESERVGITEAESELIKYRSSQINGCAFCLNLHAEAARQAGLEQQKLDVLETWRETTLFSEREMAFLMIAEASARVPLDFKAVADLEDARRVLGDELFSVAEWEAIGINTFNRISILSEHPVRPRKK